MKRKFLSSMLAAALLENGAARGGEVLASSTPRYPNRQSYFAAVNQFLSDRNLIFYRDNGAEICF